MFSLRTRPPYVALQYGGDLGSACYRTATVQWRKNVISMMVLRQLVANQALAAPSVFKGGGTPYGGLRGELVPARGFEPLAP